MSLNCGAIITKQFFCIRAHVNFPSTNRYNSSTRGAIFIYFNAADTSPPQLQLCHLHFFVFLCYGFPFAIGGLRTSVLLIFQIAFLG